MGIENIENILFDYFAGELSANGIHEVDEWRKESPKHEAKFQQFRKDFFMLRWGMRNSLIRGNYNQIKYRLQRRLWIRRSKIAASILIMLGGISWILLNREYEDHPIVSSQVISPGKKQAILVLSTGQTIEMDSATLELPKEVFVQDLVRSKVRGSNIDSYNTLIIPRGGEYAITLSDSTKVWLNSDTRLRFPLSFNDSEERIVYLTGEAYFEVSENKECPFIVRTEDADVKVFGTKFQVSSYSSEYVAAVLVEGSIGMSYAGKERKITEGQKIVANRDKQDLEVTDVDIAPYIAWKEGNFVFKNESLEDILKKMARWYNIEVFFENEEAKNVRFSGDMKRYSDITSFLHYFEKISDVKFKLRKQCLIVE